MKIIEKNIPSLGGGDYENYKKAYNAFKDQYTLKKTYKEIDIFLWTYAVAIQNYWEKEFGIWKFEPIQYKPMK